MKTEYNQWIGRRLDSGLRDTAVQGAKTKPVSHPEPLDLGEAIAIKPMHQLERA